jgi:hypothetical protein
MNARGFALLEWVIASAFIVAIAAALFGAVGPVRDTFERVQQAADLAAGARSALELLVADVREARSEAGVAPRGVMMATLLPALQLLQDLDSGVAAQPAAAITTRRIPLSAAQSRLRSDVLAGESLLRLEMGARCSAGAPSCGFRSGDHAVLMSDANAELVTVEAELADAVMLQAPLTSGFAAGAVLCRIMTTTYGLRPIGGGSARLVRLTDGGAEQPLLDDVVTFEITADAEDPLVMRRLSVRLRVEAAPDHLRGPPGDLFVRGGTADSARRWLPDVELRTNVALRNGGLPW